MEPFIEESKRATFLTLNYTTQLPLHAYNDREQDVISVKNIAKVESRPKIDGRYRAGPAGHLRYPRAPMGGIVKLWDISGKCPVQFSW